MKKILLLLISLLIINISPQLQSFFKEESKPKKQINSITNNQNNRIPPVEERIFNNKIKETDITNPLSSLVLVNKNEKLPTNFTPPDLVIPDIPFTFSGAHPKKMMRKKAARAVEKLFTQARKENIKIAGISAYRSYDRQKAIFNYKAQLKGQELANKTSARPGESEHQTGLAIDVSSAGVNYRLIEKLGQTKEGKWLAQNAPNYGFIIRYPKRKSQITGYQYEPWHLRYVGIKHAVKISKYNLTLEEYLISSFLSQEK